MTANDDTQAARERMARAKRILAETFGDQELGGIWVSDDGMRIMGQVFIDDMACTVTYELDEDSGEYKMQGYNALGMLKF